MPTRERNGDPPPQVLQAQDPTRNVRDSLAAAVERLDDLAQLRQQRGDELRAAEATRLNESIEAERRRVDEQMALRSEYEAKLQSAEAKRIDAIRVVDVNAVAVANERATQQATVLATQVAASADTLRALVATTASTVATQLQQITATLSDRLAIVERANYEGSGRQAVADPALTAALLALAEAQKTTANKLETLGTVQSQRIGQGIGAGQVVAYIFSALAALAAIGAIIAYVVKP